MIFNCAWHHSCVDKVSVLSMWDSSAPSQHEGQEVVASLYFLQCASQNVHKYKPALSLKHVDEVSREACIQS